MDEEKRSHHAAQQLSGEEDRAGGSGRRSAAGIPGGEAVPEPEWHRAEFGDGGVRRATARQAQAVPHDFRNATSRGSLTRGRRSVCWIDRLFVPRFGVALCRL